MMNRFGSNRWWPLSVAALVIVAFTISPLMAQGTAQASAQGAPAGAGAGASAGDQPAEHPLMPSVRWARQGLQQMENHLQDYSATMIKQERIGDELQPEQKVFLKVRHKPFSAYMYFLSPADVKGQEAMYVAGANDGKMWGHAAPGFTNSLVGTVSLKPDGMLAMRGQRYPITEVGIKNLVRRLLEVGLADAQYGECNVCYRDVKINGHECLCIEVTHPVARKNFRFHIAKIYVDKKMNLPIRYESWDWPKNPGDKPELLEAYTYLDLKINPGFTDMDFNPKNPDYGFEIE